MMMKFPSQIVRVRVAHEVYARMCVRVCVRARARACARTCGRTYIRDTPCVRGPRVRMNDDVEVFNLRPLHTALHTNHVCTCHVVQTRSEAFAPPAMGLRRVLEQ